MANMENIRYHSKEFENQINSLFQELFGESERASALVAAAFIDDLLGKIIVEYSFINTDKEIIKLLMDAENNSPLSTLGIRINYAYAIGLLTKDQRNDLKIVAKIRNFFAHELNASFNDKRISDLCANLKKPDLNLNYINSNPRTLFTVFAAFIISVLREKYVFIHENHIKGVFKY